MFVKCTVLMSNSDFPTNNSDLKHNVKDCELQEEV
jgi:hypothetical protein